MSKLSTDESVIDNLRNMGIGDILRDNKGNMIYVFATPLGMDSNNQAEVQATIFGITW